LGRTASVRKRDRALRRAVVRLQGCLARVPRAERRVLVLRAGIGIAHTRSRATVARITGLRRSRVARLERRGLHHLRALGRAGACAISTTTSAHTALTALPVASGSTQSGGPASGRLGGRGGVLAERRSGTSHPSQHAGESQSSVLPLRQPGRAPTGSSSFDLMIVFIPLALVVFALMMVREIRRSA
jgi:hypothetical protein